jgi:hypothetical protein
MNLFGMKHGSIRHLSALPDGGFSFSGFRILLFSAKFNDQGSNDQEDFLVHWSLSTDS